MRRLVISLSLLFAVLGIFASNPLTDTITAGKNSFYSERVRTKSDTTRLLFQKMGLPVDSLTMSDYTLSIERVNDNLNAVGDSAKLGYEVVKMSRRVGTMTNDIGLIRQNIRGRHAVFNIKNQYLYLSFTTKLDNETHQIQAIIEKLYQREYNAKQHLNGALSDSVFRKLYSDKGLRTAFDKKLSRLERKYNRTDSITRANIDSLNNLKVRLSDNSVNLSGMLNILESRMDKSVPKLFGHEVKRLWETGVAETPAQEPSKDGVSLFGSEKNAIGYYISQTSGERKLIFFLGIVLFTWLFLKRKLLKKLKEQRDSYIYLHLQYLNNFPIFSLLLLLLFLMPLFDAYAPTSYISMVYLLLLIASTVIFLKSRDQSFLINWFGLVTLFVTDVMAFLFLEPVFLERILLLAIHAGIIVFALRINKSLDLKLPYSRFIKSAAISGIVLAGLGILFNLFGRFSLSGIVGIAAVFAVTQTIILPVFVDVIIEIIVLQLQSSRLSKGIDKPFDTSAVVDKIKMPVIFVAVIIWLIMVTSNLNIYHSISASITDALTSVRTIGSISFQLISVILFFIIIWFAHILQRLLSFFYGETGAETEDTILSKGQHSRLLITRLLVLICGYLLAIAVSGLPIDKLTFLLGALGIGIGMGLQNIVNNFVSGIILIFDGSLQIGDEVEVSGRSGKVKEIGLRSSTLTTSDGADVIIPNGNILSQNIVNWTYSNNEKRVMLRFSLSGKELDANVISEVINTTIKRIPNVISKRIPVILFTKVTPETCTINIRFWSTISNVDLVKSEAMIQLSGAFAAKNIGFE